MRSTQLMQKVRSSTRLIGILLLSFILCFVAIGIRALKKSQASTTIPAMTQHQPGSTIDGAINPDMIPDHIAYSLLFRLISGRERESEKKSIRAYIRQMGLGEQQCQSCPKQKESGDLEIDTLIAVAETFQQRISALDRQAKVIKEYSGHHPSSDAMAQLRDLQTQKEAIVTEIVASLPVRLGPAAMEKVSQHVEQRVKRHVKIFSNPAIHTH